MTSSAEISACMKAGACGGAMMFHPLKLPMIMGLCRLSHRAVTRVAAEPLGDIAHCWDHAPTRKALPGRLRFRHCLRHRVPHVHRSSGRLERCERDTLPSVCCGADVVIICVVHELAHRTRLA